MSLEADLKDEVTGIFSTPWKESNGQKVPSPEDLLLGNDARFFERATILYADLSGSTHLVDTHHWQIAGEVYKSYLRCAANIIRSQEGIITAYDGDRIMAVFIGDMQTTRAAICGFKINWAVINIINPALKKQYPNVATIIKQVVGIDTSPVRAARIGVRGDNDLVWIGRAANYAAKLTECRNDNSTWITKDAYNLINKNKDIR